MSQTFVVGDRVTFRVPSVVGGPDDTNVSLVMAVGEHLFAFSRRVDEAAGLAEGMRHSLDGTAFTAMQTRLAAIDN